MRALSSDYFYESKEGREKNWLFENRAIAVKLAPWRRTESTDEKMW